MSQKLILLKEDGLIILPNRVRSHHVFYKLLVRAIKCVEGSHINKKDTSGFMQYEFLPWKANTA